MLTTPNKTTWGLLRKLLVLPLTLVAVGVLSVSMIERKANAIVAPMIAPVILTQQPGITSTAPEPAVSSPVKQKKIFRSVPVQQPAKQVEVFDTVPAPAQAKENPPNIIASNSNEHIVLKADGIILNLKARDSATVKAKLPNVIYYLNNQLTSIDEVGKLDPGQIKSISVWKGEDALKKFGASGSNGVIEIFTKVTP